MQSLLQVQRSYEIPHTRLPFVNAEIASVDFGGVPHLASSVWGGAAGSRLYFWNPDTGSSDFRPFPDGIPGAYMLKTGPDGLLYAGCGNGDLIRYDPAADGFDSLVSGVFSSITWGGCVTDRFVVWAASPGEAAVYDRTTASLVKVFRPVDTESPSAHYGHCVLQAPDGRVLIGMNTPQARLVLLDTSAMRAVSHTPDCLVGQAFATGLMFLDDSTLALSAGSDFLMLSFPDLALKTRVPPPEGESGLTVCRLPVAGRVFAVGSSSGDLYSMDPSVRSWDRAAPGWCPDVHLCMHPWKGHSLAGVTSDGRALLYDTRTSSSSQMDLQASGPLPAHALCASPDASLIVGAPFINQRFWSIDMRTGSASDLGRAAPGGGQVNQVVWDPATRRFLLSSYTTASVTAYDPSSPAGWPVNPCLLASAESHGQMRPMALVHDGRFAWMATSPRYGTLGGALSRIDPATGDILTWKNLVPDQKLNSIVIDPASRTLFFGTEIYADCDSAPPTRSRGRMVSFDMDALSVVRERPVAEDAPSATVLALLPGGRVLAGAGPAFFSWDPASDTLTALENAPPHLREIARDEHGRLWAAAAGGVGLLSLDNDRFGYEPMLDIDGRFLHVAGGILYFTAGNRVFAARYA
ncbi:MAG: hypothetical protein JW909_11645 [Planctomycetes bacterium]|nr:hypothetical protein [Planctomycetota bacterium]